MRIVSNQLLVPGTKEWQDKIHKEGFDQLHAYWEEYIWSLKEKYGIAPLAGGSPVWDEDLILLAATADFGEGEDGTHSAVTIEPSSAFLVRLQVGTTWTGTSPTLDLTIQMSDDNGSTFRNAVQFPQIAEADAETNGQEFYFEYCVVGQPAAGQVLAQMRAVTDALGTTPNLGTVSILVTGVDLPRNFPTGIVGRSLVGDVALRFA